MLNFCKILCRFVRIENGGRENEEKDDSKWTEVMHMHININAVYIFIRICNQFKTRACYNARHNSKCQRWTMIVYNSLWNSEIVGVRDNSSNTSLLSLSYIWLLLWYLINVFHLKMSAFKSLKWRQNLPDEELMTFIFKKLSLNTFYRYNKCVYSRNRVFARSNELSKQLNRTLKWKPISKV